MEAEELPQLIRSEGRAGWTPRREKGIELGPQNTPFNVVCSRSPAPFLVRSGTIEKMVSIGAEFCSFFLRKPFLCGFTTVWLRGRRRWVRGKSRIQSSSGLFCIIRTFSRCGTCVTQEL